MHQALHRGQLTFEELVDRHTIRNRSVRRLLLDYFHRRRSDTDYASLVHLVRHVAHHFWARIEEINPEQADLNISADLYSTWRRQIGVRHDGKPRIGVDTIVIAVRSFYYDLHTWAADEPEQWGPWVASCPVPPSELRGLAKRRRRINERSADRTRQRQPLLPLLVRHVEERYDRTRTLLEQASAAAANTSFTHDGRTYRRVQTQEDLTRIRSGHRTPVRVRDDIGQLIQIEAEEETAFWDWASVETLRHSGVRIEELCEVSHLSIRHYQRSNGEMVALLVISPSKTDRERHPDVRRAVPRNRNHHPSAHPRRQAGPGSATLRPARQGLEPAHAFPVPAQDRLHTQRDQPFHRLAHARTVLRGPR